MSDHNQSTEPADPEAAPRETVAFIRPETADAGATVVFAPAPAPAASAPRPPAPPPPPAPPAPPPSFRVTPPPPTVAPAAADAVAGPPSSAAAVKHDVAPDPVVAVVSPTESGPVMDPVATETATAVVQAERAADVASSGPRPITPLETEDDHTGRNVLISIVIVLVVAAIVAGIVIAI